MTRATETGGMHPNSHIVKALATERARELTDGAGHRRSAHAKDRRRESKGTNGEPTAPPVAVRSDVSAPRLRGLRFLRRSA